MLGQVEVKLVACLVPGVCAICSRQRPPPHPRNGRLRALPLALLWEEEAKAWARAARPLLSLHGPRASPRHRR